MPIVIDRDLQALKATVGRTGLLSGTKTPQQRNAAYNYARTLWLQIANRCDLPLLGVNLDDCSYSEIRAAAASHSDLHEWLAEFDTYMRIATGRDANEFPEIFNPEIPPINNFIIEDKEEEKAKSTPLSPATSSTPPAKFVAPPSAFLDLDDTGVFPGEKSAASKKDESSSTFDKLYMVAEKDMPLSDPDERDIAEHISKSSADLARVFDEEEIDEEMEAKAKEEMTSKEKLEQELNARHAPQHLTDLLNDLSERLSKEEQIPAEILSRTAERTYAFFMDEKQNDLRAPIAAAIPGYTAFSVTQKSDAIASLLGGYVRSHWSMRMPSTSETKDATAAKHNQVNALLKQLEGMFRERYRTAHQLPAATIPSSAPVSLAAAPAKAVAAAATSAATLTAATPVVSVAKQSSKESVPPAPSKSTIESARQHLAARLTESKGASENELCGFLLTEPGLWTTAIPVQINNLLTQLTTAARNNDPAFNLDNWTNNLANAAYDFLMAGNTLHPVIQAALPTSLATQQDSPEKVRKILAIFLSVLARSIDELPEPFNITNETWEGLKNSRAWDGIVQAMYDQRTAAAAVSVSAKSASASVSATAAATPAPALVAASTARVSASSSSAPVKHPAPIADDLLKKYRNQLAHPAPQTRGTRAALGKTAAPLPSTAPSMPSEHKGESKGIQFVRCATTQLKQVDPALSMENLRLLVKVGEQEFKFSACFDERGRIKDGEPDATLENIAAAIFGNDIDTKARYKIFLRRELLDKNGNAFWQPTYLRTAITTANRDASPLHNSEEKNPFTLEKDGSLVQKRDFILIGLANAEDMTRLADMTAEEKQTAANLSTRLTIKFPRRETPTQCEVEHKAKFLSAVTPPKDWDTLQQSLVDEGFVGFTPESLRAACKHADEHKNESYQMRLDRLQSIMASARITILRQLRQANPDDPYNNEDMRFILARLPQHLEAQRPGRLQRLTSADARRFNAQLTQAKNELTAMYMDYLQHQLHPIRLAIKTHRSYNLRDTLHSLNTLRMFINTVDVPYSVRTSMVNQLMSTMFLLAQQPGAAGAVLSAFKDLLPVWLEMQRPTWREWFTSSDAREFNATLTRLIKNVHAALPHLEAQAAVETSATSHLTATPTLAAPPATTTRLPASTPAVSQTVVNVETERAAMIAASFASTAAAATIAAAPATASAVDVVNMPPVDSAKLEAHAERARTSASTTNESVSAGTVVAANGADVAAVPAPTPATTGTTASSGSMTDMLKVMKATPAAAQNNPPVNDAEAAAAIAPRTPPTTPRLSSGRRAKRIETPPGTPSPPPCGVEARASHASGTSTTPEATPQTTSTIRVTV
jgi:hypothetical protein